MFADICKFYTQRGIDGIRQQLPTPRKVSSALVTVTDTLTNAEKLPLLLKAVCQGNGPGGPNILPALHHSQHGDTISHYSNVHKPGQSTEKSSRTHTHAQTLLSCLQRTPLCKTSSASSWPFYEILSPFKWTLLNEPNNHCITDSRSCLPSCRLMFGPVLAM